MREVRLSPSGGFDNAAREYRHIAVRPVAAAMGAEVLVDLRGLSDAAFAELQDAFWHHKMVFLRNQHLTHAEHEAFALRWGPFAPDAYTHGVPGHPGVQPLVKEADARSKGLFGSGWLSCAKYGGLWPPGVRFSTSAIVKLGYGASPTTDS